MAKITGAELNRPHYDLVQVEFEISAQSVNKWLRCRLFSIQSFCRSAWKNAVLQGHSFHSRLDPFQLEGKHKNFS